MSDEMEQYKSRINILENELAFTNRDLELTKQNAKDTKNRVEVLERELMLTTKMSKTSDEISKFNKDGSHVITNVGGGFDSNTSTFKAPITGVYHFDVIIMSHSGEDMETEIVKNGNTLVRLYSGSGDTWGVGMQAIVVQMNVGDDVWIRVMDNPPINDGNIRVYGERWSSFSGFLL
ncbi:unnamed protein product [Mytilus edulis]|uniref:C1q domain-containing protein n=1 Tax=Mytilus edulis TaxID=6550 RepID=A0A8S3S360_MYTED|nr:unnamed protein product [Mytilus edulis]